MDLPTLTDEAIRVAIAEACGWYKCRSKYSCGRWHDADGTKHETDPPDYLNSLDAIHAAEQTLSAEEQEEYGYQFLQIVENTRTRTVGQHGFQVAHATAAQRAQAFVRTIAARAQREEKP